MKRNTMSATLVLLALFLGAITLGCKRSSESAREGVNASKQPVEQHIDYVKFKTFNYTDRKGIGTKAFSLLIPSGWKFRGGIRWVLNNPAMPAVAAFTVTSPSSPAEFEAFPAQPFFWTNNRMLLSSFPIGSRYFGSEVRPPMGPLDTLKRIVLPRFRSRAVNLRIVGEKRLPGLARSLGAGGRSAPGLRSSADGAKIRIEYRQNGVPMEEEIYDVVETSYYSMPSMYGTITNINWIADYLFSFKAEKGKLDGLSKLFQTMAYSFRLNPQWFNKYNQLVGQLVQMQIRRIRNIGEISRIISRTNDEISDMVMQSYNERQAVNDRIADNFSQYIRGVDKYQDPIGRKPVELPGGYENAWTNSLGEYVLSDNPNFNPNVGSNLDWQRMEKR